MLEVKWKEYPKEVTRQRYKSFNPCYVGSKMERRLKTVTESLETGFNPCYVGSKMERKEPISHDDGQP